MAGRHNTDSWTSIHDVRDHARRCALAGKPIYVNPYIGNDAETWFAAYREVPEAERGSQPHLLAGSMKRLGQGRQRNGANTAARGSELGMLSTSQIATRIGYHERILETSVCAAQRQRSERALAKLRTVVPCDAHIATPKPWAEGAGL